ncbi:hypothetical protein [Prescottella agglutinans]|uniref:Uncharacterized protein n=1 Tax=Prescottella agglutinans TaxID=1644129 RepID=A0ABT6ME42_9NOCA|nr:hypothetical protein [Prescottella agglutinans]MDH6282566.1 hypothetical protein [Prescottella agglutinans]
MDLVVTSDTGAVGDVYTLADELRQARETFLAATPSTSGTLLLCLRCLPAHLRRRSFTRFERTEPTLLVDLCVTEEAVRGLTAAQQREMLGVLLQEWLGKAFRSRSAPWTPQQRAELREAAARTLASLGWLDRARARAAVMLRAGRSLDDVAEASGLDLDEVENLFVELTSS